MGAGAQARQNVRERNAVRTAMESAKDIQRGTQAQAEQLAQKYYDEARKNITGLQDVRQSQTEYSAGKYPGLTQPFQSYMQNEFPEYVSQIKQFRPTFIGDPMAQQSLGVANTAAQNAIGNITGYASNVTQGLGDITSSMGRNISRQAYRDPSLNVLLDPNAMTAVSRYFTPYNPGGDSTVRQFTTYNV